MLRKILADKIELEPVGSGRQRGYKFRGALSLEKLIAGEAMNSTSDCGGPNGLRTRVYSRSRFRQAFHLTPYRLAHEDSRRLEHASKSALQKQDTTSHGAGRFQASLTGGDAKAICFVGH
jgi:hypothetical protein